MSTITLPSGLEVLEGRVLVLPRSSAIMPVGDLTPSEVQALRDDVANAMNLELGDLANVSEDGKATGEALLVLPDGSWGPGKVVGAIERVRPNWNTNEALEVNLLTVGEGIDVAPTLSTNGRAHLQLVRGATGSDNAVPRNDHQHPPTFKGRLPFDEGGSMLSAGTRMLVDETITGITSGVVYDVDITGRVEVVNSNTSGRVVLNAQIGAGSVHSLSRGASGGVWTDLAMTSTLMTIGGSSFRLRFWLTYESGDPCAIYSGELSYAIDPQGGTP